MVDAFRELDRLHELDYFFPEPLKEQIRKDPRWKRYAKEDVKSEEANSQIRLDNIPMYTDMGFLVARADLAASLTITGGADTTGLFSSTVEESHNSPTSTGEWESTAAALIPPAKPKIVFERSTSWARIDELSRMIKKVPNGNERPTVFGFALPYLFDKTEFMAFFFEVLWSRGGDVYHFPIYVGDEGPERDLFYRNCLLGNKSIWRHFLSLTAAASAYTSMTNNGSKYSGLYSRDEVIERILPLVETLRKIDQTDRGARLLEDAVNIGDPKQAVEELNELLNNLILNRDEFFDSVDTITINNKFGHQALAFIYDMVFDKDAGVPNPFDGDFRDKAVYSRRWYSQIESGDEKQHFSRVSAVKPRDKRIHVLPLPHFEENGRKRSCTTENVWCLGMVKEALSPEIGWIYIDTLTSPEWITKRAANRLGLPFRFEDLKRLEGYDPEVYRILQEVVKNKQQKDRVYAAERSLAARQKKTEDQISLDVAEFLNGQYHERDVADVLTSLESSKNVARRDAPELAANLDLRVQKLLERSGVSWNDNTRVSEMPDFEQNIEVRSKVPASRPFFYRVESILHGELVRLFSPQGRRELYTEMFEKSSTAMTDEDINEHLAARRSQEKNCNISGPITHVLKRMDDRLVFDLLTTTHEQLQRLWTKLTHREARDVTHEPQRNAARA